MASAAPVPLALRGVPLTRRVIYILPTRHGIAFAAVLLVMLIGATNYENALGFALTFLLAAVALVSILHTHRNINGLRVEARAIEPVFAGGNARFEVTLCNDDAFAKTALMVRTKSTVETCTSTHVDAETRASVTITQPAHKRGWCALDDVIIATRYPLGLFRAWSRVQLDTRCLIYPRPLGDSSPPELGNGEYGGALGATQDGQDDFSALRGYRAGDSPKHVHWRALARGREMSVKTFTRESAGSIRLTWHTLNGDVEQRLSQLSRWILLAEQRGLNYTLEIPGVTLPSSCGPQHRHTALSALALYKTI